MPGTGDTNEKKKLTGYQDGHDRIFYHDHPNILLIFCANLLFF
jgi:hypothetical protein